MLTINTNTSSLMAQSALSNNQSSLSVSLQRLSTGLRINSAADDAAGYAISQRMTSQVNGLNQAVRNANDGVSLSQTAGAGLSSIASSLQRMRELAVQSANDTNSASDRASLQSEVSQLQAEINRVATTTQFNGKNLLDGTLANAQFQVGANANQIIGVNVANAQSNAIGNFALDVTAGASANGVPTAGGNLNTAVSGAANDITAGGSLTINGPTSNGTSASVTYTAGETGYKLAADVNALSNTTGVHATAITEASLTGMSYASGVTFSLSNNETGSSPVTITLAAGGSDQQLADAINAQGSKTGISAQVQNGKLMLESQTGGDISITSATGGAIGASLTGYDAFTGASGSTSVALTSGAPSATVGASIEFNATGAFDVTDTAGKFMTASTKTYGVMQTVNNIDISSQTGAAAAMNIIDGAIAMINSQQASLGAIQNRFNNTISNLQSTSQNLSSAQSRIQDTDFASETAKLSRAQILQQAGTAMLAQANQLPQQVLKLLQ